MLTCTNTHKRAHTLAPTRTHCLVIFDVVVSGVIRAAEATSSDSKGAAQPIAFQPSKRQMWQWAPWATVSEVDGESLNTKGREGRERRKRREGELLPSLIPSLFLLSDTHTHSPKRLHKFQQVPKATWVDFGYS